MTTLPTAIFVKGLAKGATEKHLQFIFSHFGVLLDCQIARHRSGRSAGFAIITFSTHEEASQAMACVDNSIFLGRKLSVRCFQPERDGPSSGCEASVPASKHATSLQPARGIHSPTDAVNLLSMSHTAAAGEQLSEHALQNNAELPLERNGSSHWAGLVDSWLEDYVKQADHVEPPVSMMRSSSSSGDDVASCSTSSTAGDCMPTISVKDDSSSDASYPEASVHVVGSKAMHMPHFPHPAPSFASMKQQAYIQQMNRGICTHVLPVFSKQQAMTSGAVLIPHTLDSVQPLVQQLQLQQQMQIAQQQYANALAQMQLVQNQLAAAAAVLQPAACLGSPALPFSSCTLLPPALHPAAAITMVQPHFL